MSYLFIIVIGVACGWAGAQWAKNAEMGVGIDLLAGGAGAVVVVFLTRLLAPAAATSMVASAVVAVTGAILSLYAMHYVMKTRPEPKPRRQRGRY